MSTSINPIKSSKFSILKNKESLTFDKWFFDDLDWDKQYPGIVPFSEKDVFLSELSHSPEDSYDVDVYIMAGQSNMLGSAPILDLPESDLSSDALFYTSWHSNTSNAETLQNYSNWSASTVAGNTRGGSSSLFGPEIGFASKLSQLNNSNKKIAILKYAVGASSLNAGDDSLSDWDTEINEHREGDCWRGLQKALQNGINKLVATGYSYRIRGFVWWQGESGSSVDGLNNFILKTRSFINEKYNTINGGSIPFIITKIGYGTDLTPVADQDTLVNILDASKYGHSPENNHVGSGENDQPLDTNENGLNDMLDAGHGFASLMYMLLDSENSGLDDLTSLYDNGDSSWKIRIGKGGNIYSIKINNSEQLICPQHRRGGLSPWNDDCMTGVVQSGSAHMRSEDDGGVMQHSNGFVHASGMYIRQDLDADNNKLFTCPLVGENFDGADRSYTVINLGLVPKPSVNRPDVLFYHKYRDLGAGVLELTMFAYNFGNIDYKWGNFPWFAVRRKPFTNQIVGQSDGTYVKRDLVFSKSDFEITDESYGGWMAKTENIALPETSMTMGHVTGKDKYDTERFLCRAGIAGYEERDFQLFNLAWTSLKFPPGKCFFNRTFFVFGNLQHVSETCQNLVNKVEYGYPEIPEQVIDLYEQDIDGYKVLSKSGKGQKICKVFSLPIQDSVPLFLLKDKTTGEHIVSPDPYLICDKPDFPNPYPVDSEFFEEYSNRVLYKPYDGKTEWVELLGYVKKIENNEISTGYNRLSDLIYNINFKAGEMKTSEELMTLPL